MTPGKKENPASRERRPQHRSPAPSPSRWRNLLSSAFFPGKLLDCHWAQSWIEASNIKHSLPEPDLQFWEAAPAGHWSLCVGLSTPGAKSITGVCIICVLLPLPASGASSESSQVPNSCHTFVRLPLQPSHYWSSWVISLSFRISQHAAICFPSNFNRLLTTASFLPTFIILATLYIAIKYIKGKFVDILFNPG